MGDLLSATPQALNDLVVSPPFIWPDARVLTKAAAYHESPPSKKCFASADLISGVLVGADDATIDWLTELLKRDIPCRICLVLILHAAGPTRGEHLRALHMLQASRASQEKKVDLRLLPLHRCYDGDCERPVFPPTAIQAHDSKTGQTLMCVGSTGDAGHDAVILGSLNLVFQPDAALRDEWRRWFQFLFESATPLSEDSCQIPHLVPAKGDPEAAAAWAAYVQSCARTETGETSAMPAVDPKTGEVIATKEGDAVTTWDGGATALDSLAQVFQQVYANGWLVTVDETTRIRPLSLPVKAALLGQESERTIGALTQRQSFSLKVLDTVSDKALEKFRKVTDLVGLLTLPLSKGNHWVPDAARELLEKEVELRNTKGRQELIKALGGDQEEDIIAFIAAKKESLRKSVDEMYRTMGQGDAVPADKFEAVLQDIEARLKQALEARVTPRLVFNRIAAPSLEGQAPDDNWSQPLSLLSHSAETLRNLVADPYFVRQFVDLSFGENEFREAFNPFNDQISTKRDTDRCRNELRVVEALLDSELSLKAKCEAIWQLTQGMPHFYFETRFRVPEPPPPWPDEFAILTAYATTGRLWTDEQNRAADRQMQQELAGLGPAPSRITGYSPATGHAEPGWAAGIPWQEACDLGLKYKQDAIYFVKEDQLFVSYYDERRALVPVGSFLERLKA